MGRLRRALCIGLVAATAFGLPAGAQETVGPTSSLTAEGRHLEPAGRMTPVGAFPTGGAITPDGRFYWAVDAGRGMTAVRVIDLASGDVRQTLPIPGGYVGIAFASDGSRAYVSGIPADGRPAQGLRGAGGDVVHVYDVDAASGAASEVEPIALPNARDGAAAGDGLPPASNVAAWPEGLDLTADDRYLVVALGQADQVAIIELTPGHPTTLVNVGRYPYGVATDPERPRAYVTNERDGTVSVVEVPSGRVLDTIGVGGPRGAAYAHAQGLAMDPARHRLYVAVNGRDLVAVIDTDSNRVVRYVDVGRPEAEIGTAPVNVAVAPDGETLYVANAGEDAVAAVALADRPAADTPERAVVRPRSPRSIGRYRSALARARARASDSAAARRRYVRRAAALRRRYLHGRRGSACAGPSTRQDRGYGRSVLRAFAARDRSRRRGVSRVRARRAFDRAVRRAQARLPRIVRCDDGFLAGAKAFDLLGRIPTASYPTDVEVSPDGRRLVWLSAKGLGTGPNTGEDADISRLLIGRVGALDRPTDREVVALTATADRQVVPTNSGPPPPNSPIPAPGGGASPQIRYVFYVVRENRTYDQIFGSEPRGRGDPRLQVFDDNGVPGPTGGVTPNAHALARRFPLLDNVYANSEESTVGHKIAAGGSVNDYTQRYVNASRGRRGNPDIFAIGIPPNAFVFDQAVRQGVPFRVYGELGAGNQPFADDGRDTFESVLASTDPVYPSQVQGSCRPAVPVVPSLPASIRCSADSGNVGATAGPSTGQSRMRTFAPEFALQLATGTVPRFNYLILFNDHTDGTAPGAYTPKAMVADNDLALGQLVELVSNSPIWRESAIFVMEDDSQDGIDSVDAHRIPAFVISPWARRGVVVSTRYDQYSMLHTAELIAGLRPLGLNDALATPMYDAFISGDEQPDVEGTRYRAIQPQQSLIEINAAGAANARLSAALPWDEPDLVPQRLADRIIWQSVFGSDAAVPPPGPNASPIERARATGALRTYRAGGDVRRWLEGHSEEEDE